ncbi:hypothetical protein L9F63_022859, partial [Diploptera punctata]
SVEVRRKIGGIRLQYVGSMAEVRRKYGGSTAEVLRKYGGRTGVVRGNYNRKYGVIRRKYAQVGRKCGGSTLRKYGVVRGGSTAKVGCKETAGRTSKFGVRGGSTAQVRGPGYERKRDTNGHTDGGSTEESTLLRRKYGTSPAEVAAEIQGIRRKSRNREYDGSTGNTSEVWRKYGWSTAGSTRKTAEVLLTAEVRPQVHESTAQ